MTWWTWPGLRGAVLEQIPGRLLDIGAGGCLVAADSLSLRRRGTLRPDVRTVIVVVAALALLAPALEP